VSCCLPHSLRSLVQDSSALALHIARLPLAEAGARELLPSSLASLARPGQQCASLAQHGGGAIRCIQE
jgi:hypothetical protein